MRTSRFLSASRIVLGQESARELSRSFRRDAPSVAEAVGLLLLTCSALGCAGATPSEQQQVLTVAADGSAQYASIQAAVDAAPEGATIRIGPGTYAERVTLAKRLTLEGAGWDRTRISMPYGDLAAIQRSIEEESTKAAKAGANLDELTKLSERLWREQGPRPTLRVEGARGVVLQGLSFAQPGTGPEGSVSPSSVIELASTEARLQSCAVLGSPGSGIVISGASDVQMKHCLVAGILATGIAISDSEPRVLVSECEVRNCRHRGITVAHNASTTIERCRISGSAWHGIRCDDAEPKVVGNLIFENERCGIYSSGTTKAEVRGNLFFKNGMTGYSGWLQSADTVEGNTFAEDIRSAVEVLGAAKPSIRHNIFFDLKQAVALGNTQGEPAIARTTGEVDLADNVFWRVERKAVGPAQDGKTMADLPVASLNGNREEDPRFVNAAGRDFRLAADSPLRSAGVGAADPMGFDSAWPTQAEEETVTALRTKQQQRDDTAASAQAAWRVAKPWIDDLLQITDVGKRDAALQSVRTALASPDPLQRHAGLMAFVQSSQASYDHAAFRDLVLPMCSSQTGAMQVQAFYGLNNAGRRPGDEALLLRALETPSPDLVQSGTTLLMLYFDRSLQGEAAEATLKLLDAAGNDSALQRNVLGGLMSANASLEVQERLVELAKRPELRHDAIYYCLSTLQTKSRPVVEFLLSVLEDGDWEDTWRTLWGLKEGVAAPEHALVAEKVLNAYEARNEVRMQSYSLELLAQYCDATHLPKLRQLAENPLLQDSLRAELQKTIATIEAR